LIRILELEVQKVTERLQGKKMQILLDDKARTFLVEKGFDPVYGARPMRRAVERYLEDPLAEEILRGHLHQNEPIQVSAEADKLVFNQATTAEGALSS
jgi:ATP-dependent Clp protease ATP-binding subunit ClpC